MTTEDATKETMRLVAQVERLHEHVALLRKFMIAQVHAMCPRCKIPNGWYVLGGQSIPVGDPADKRRFECVVCRSPFRLTVEVVDHD